MTKHATGSNAPSSRERTLEEAIGRRVRQLRHKLGLNGIEFAAAAGISTSMLSKLETGQISASLQTLSAVSAALGVSITSLFSASEQREDCSVVPAGEGVTITRRGTKAGHRYQLLGHMLDDTIAVEPFLITLAEDAVPYAGFQHEGIELIYMLSGRVVYRHGESRYTLSPGDTMFFDATAPHGPEDLLQLPMTYLSVIIYARN